MKRFMVLITFVYWMVIGGALAQSKPTSMTGSSVKSTPQTQPSGKILLQNSSIKSLRNSNEHALNIQLRLQQLQIKKDLKAGKITKAQAHQAWNILKSVKKQEIEFFRQNGQKEITDDQKNQLSSAIEKNTF